MKVQNIAIELTNGKELKATVPEFFKEGDSLDIIKVRVYPAFELPAHMKMEVIDFVKEGTSFDMR